MSRDYQQDFIEFALQHQVLKFGEFSLKSGRQSPYFFNAGLFHSGEALAKLGEFYAQALVDAQTQHQLNFDMLFGPAYKGIPLVSSTAIALANQHQQNLPYCFDRKEAKDHGEGGQLVGAPLAGKVMIIDDVITAGTAIRQAISLIKSQGAEVAGIVIALDRQERGQTKLSAIQELSQQQHIPVFSIACLSDLIDYVSKDTQLQNHLTAVQTYRNQYGV